MVAHAFPRHRPTKAQNTAQLLANGEPLLRRQNHTGMLSPGALFSTDLKGPTLWTGGSYGFEASLLAYLVELVILVILCIYAPRWAGDAEAWPYYQKKR